MAKDLDDEIRNLIRDYRIKHGKDPPCLNMHPTTYTDVVGAYSSVRRQFSPFQAATTNVNGQVYGVPIILSTSVGKVNYSKKDRNGCRIKGELPVEVGV